MNNKKEFIIYGAGERGKWCYELLKWRRIEDRIWGFCDKKCDEIKYVNEKRVVSYEEAKKTNIPFLISVADPNIVKEIVQIVKADGCKYYLFDEFWKILGEEKRVFLREWCAFQHAKYNNQYFEEAEKKYAVDAFWGAETLFYQYFKSLDLESVIELACGRGRHVAHYIEQAGKVTLVDILEENISICKERFKDKKNIVYYKNNGYNLESLSDNSYTALFTYDSMVHFEMMDVYEYLQDIYRVLKTGGRALFHHSNYMTDFTTDFMSNTHSRCFMGKDVFAYMAYQIGFKILKQHTLDWDGIKELDCITLLEK